MPFLSRNPFEPRRPVYFQIHGMAGIIETWPKWKQITFVFAGSRSTTDGTSEGDVSPAQGGSREDTVSGSVVFDRWAGGYTDVPDSESSQNRGFSYGRNGGALFTASGNIMATGTVTQTLGDEVSTYGMDFTLAWESTPALTTSDPLPLPAGGVLMRDQTARDIALTLGWAGAGSWGTTNHSDTVDTGLSLGVDTGVITQTPETTDLADLPTLAVSLSHVRSSVITYTPPGPDEYPPEFPSTTIYRRGAWSLSETVELTASFA